MYKDIVFVFCGKSNVATDTDVIETYDYKTDTWDTLGGKCDVNYVKGIVTMNYFSSMLIVQCNYRTCLTYKPTIMFLQ